MTDVDAIETLADLLDAMPFDGPTGAALTDADGQPDRPEDYEVLEFLRTEDGFRARVMGPAEVVDFVVDDTTGARIYRDRDYTLLFEAGEGEGYWKIEEAPDGLLCITDNDATRRVVDGRNHADWDVDLWKEDLARDGVPAKLIRRIIDQAGV